MQRFFESTIISKYIKYLLSYSPLPIYPTISSDDIIIEGCLYIYKDKILKCTKTGRFRGINSNQYIDDHLYVNEWVYTTNDPDAIARYEYDPVSDTWDFTKMDYLTVTDDIVRQWYKPVGEYQIIGDYTFGNSIPNTTQRFISNNSYYDPQTHRFLGDYLRCLRDIYGLDLMSMYNCFCYDMADNITLQMDNNKDTSATKEYIIKEAPLKAKVMLVPIKFNKTYTIAIDCDFPVLMKSIIYDGTLIEDKDGNLFTDKIPETITKFNNMQFINPVTYTVENKTATLQDYEKYLYLAIQLPNNNNSSIVVLEGDYSAVASNYISDVSSLNRISDKQLSSIFRSRLSLLEHNDNNQIPFADKLISYLLRYTIDVREYIDDNVANIETKIGYNPPLKDFYKGIWDNNLRYVLYKEYMDIENVDYIDKLDILGFVDRDIENAVWKDLIHYA